MRKITKLWLAQVSSNISGAGWTKEQFELLGIPWPPQKNWFRQVDGRLIDDDVAMKIEELGRSRRDV